MSAHDNGDCVHPIIYCPRCAAEDTDPLFGLDSDYAPTRHAEREGDE